MRLAMITATKEVIADSRVLVSTAFDSDYSGSQVRVNYMGSSRVSTSFLLADYVIDVLAESFSEAESLSYLICEKLQSYRKQQIGEIEITEYPVEYEEEGISAELRTITLTALFRA